MKRRKMNYKKSKRLFRKTSMRTHRYNLNMRPMRGGTRL
jgi:hypothetical protein